jgi:nitroimidazol reductase NimA-like FMN-containing flavoprotein (pyridoxamine 5'-phosphate oxidase superfamily)
LIHTKILKAGTMRRTDKEIRSREEIDGIIRGSDVCRIALAMDNMPYIVPVSFGYDGESIYLHTAREGKKISYFKNNNNICFEFERNVKLFANPENACKWTFSYESVIGFGKILELESVEQKEIGINKIMSHYSGKEWVFGEDQLKNIRVWKIEIASMTGKRSIKLPS